MVRILFAILNHLFLILGTSCAFVRPDITQVSGITNVIFTAYCVKFIRQSLT